MSLLSVGFTSMIGVLSSASRLRTRLGRRRSTGSLPVESDGIGPWGEHARLGGEPRVRCALVALLRGTAEPSMERRPTRWESPQTTDLLLRAGLFGPRPRAELEPPRRGLGSARRKTSTPPRGQRGARLDQVQTRRRPRRTLRPHAVARSPAQRLDPKQRRPDTRLPPPTLARPVSRSPRVVVLLP